MNRNSTSSGDSTQRNYKRLSEWEAELEDALPQGKGHDYAYWDSYARELVELTGTAGSERGEVTV